jgi:hypothetical protein
MTFHVLQVGGAPPKHRVLEHRQPKHQLLKHRMAITSTGEIINCQKHRLVKTQRTFTIEYFIQLYFLLF